MAMLSEPRQRKRYNLVPRGKALYEDDSNFGTKMLEKMGWSKGKGLGAKEDGKKDFVRVRYKNDAMGLGYEDRDDQWTHHEKGFSGLLQTLNGEGVPESGANSNDSKEQVEDSEEEVTTVGFGFAPKVKQTTTDTFKQKFSGESLEEKSKQSKARVHYKKFTRGKDLTRYSEKDLANIFGKKATEEQSNIYQQFAATEYKIEETDKEVKSNLGGLQTITAELSVGDYFKQKMEDMKSKLRNTTKTRENEEERIPLVEENSGDLKVNDEKITDILGKKAKQKKKDNKQPKDAGTTQLLECEEEPEATTVKKQKRKRAEAGQNSTNKSHVETDAENTSKKKRKQKAECLEIAMEAPKSSNPKKKSKTGKEAEQLLNESAENAENHKDEDHVDEEKNSKIKVKKLEKSKVASEKVTWLASTNQRPDSSGEDSTEEIIKATDTNSKVNNLAALSHDELLAMKNSSNVYTISTFVAEKFRHSNLDAFLGANITHITGYSCSEDLVLNIKAIKSDEKRITQLWNCMMNKYSEDVPRNTFKKYAKQLVTARKRRLKKLPHFNVKTWKRRQAFQGL